MNRRDHDDGSSISQLVGIVRTLRCLFLIVLAAGPAGCALVKDSVQLVRYRFSQSINDRLEMHRNKRWANDAWQRFVTAHPTSAVPHGFEEGFKKGFVEYLFHGGNGEPPLVPPKHFRKARFQTVDGYRTIQNWYAGYREGAAAARTCGHRDLVTGPSSVSVQRSPICQECPNGIDHSVSNEILELAPSERKAGLGFARPIKEPPADFIGAGQAAIPESLDLSATTTIDFEVPSFVAPPVSQQTPRSRKSNIVKKSSATTNQAPRRMLLGAPQALQIEPRKD